MTPELDIEQLRANAASAGALLKALANPDRLLLLCQLSQGERNVSELEQLLGIQQPTLSQQLAVLRREGSLRLAVKASRSTIESAALRRWR